MTQDYLIRELTEYAVRKKLISEEDRAYAISSLMYLMRTDSIKEETVEEPREVHLILSDLCDVAYENKIIEENSVVYRDLFDTALMGALTARPSEVIAKFEKLYSESPEAATEYFYNLACDSNYIRVDRIKKDLKWKVASEYGDIDITVNLSKPEKDPKAIAAARFLPQSDFPKCLLCHENEGFAGNLSKPARQNLRQIPLLMDKELWYVQYSPYVYYNEHCIALSSEHKPMKIEPSTFVKLIDFVEKLPHYFIGSNTDLPIVGGSILSHNHMQGGRYTFAMEKAKIHTPLEFVGYPDVKAGLVKWPLSVIRLRSANKDSLISLASKILAVWRDYTDEDAYVYAITDGEIHNTVTPIARRRGTDYELDIVLRNNITTEERPYGLYHPREELHHIKKEGIGLIEVMGLAVLPARLKSEMADMKRAILDGRDFDESESTKKHKDWYLSFKDSYTFTEENTEEILKSEIGKTFVDVLRDAGVYKDTEDGIRAFLKFIDTVNKA